MPLKMDVGSFQWLSDEKCIKKLDEHRKIEDISNCQSFLLNSFMKSITNKELG